MSEATNGPSAANSNDQEDVALHAACPNLTDVAPHAPGSEQRLAPQRRTPSRLEKVVVATTKPSVGLLLSTGANRTVSYDEIYLRSSAV